MGECRLKNPISAFFHDYSCSLSNPLLFWLKMFGGNDYTRWLSQTRDPNPVGGEATSLGNTSAIRDNRQPTSRHTGSPALSTGSPSLSTGSPALSTGSPVLSTGSPSSPGVGLQTSPASGSHSSPASASHSSPANGSQSSPASPLSQPPSARLNDLTLDELLISPGRSHLKRLHPNRPPGTLW